MLSRHFLPVLFTLVLLPLIAIDTSLADGTTKAKTAAQKKADKQKEQLACKAMVSPTGSSGLMVAPPGCRVRVECPPGKSYCAGDGVDGRWLLTCKKGEKEVTLCELPPML